MNHLLISLYNISSTPAKELLNSDMFLLSGIEFPKFLFPDDILYKMSLWRLVSQDNFRSCKRYRKFHACQLLGNSFFYFAT
jgi:hypothetical protein